MQRRLLYLLVVVLAVMPLFLHSTSTQAQSQQDEAEARVDQALEHLTGWIDAPQPLTRASALRFTWAQNVYGSPALGCPAAGTAYTEVQTVGYQIDIILDNGAGPAFDYRVSQDGTLLVLCGPDGAPLFRSDAPDLAQPPGAVNTPPPAVDPPAGTRLDIPSSQFLAITYTQAQDRLYLLNENGEVGSFPRPRSVDEAFTPGTQTPQFMTLSATGQYMAQLVQNTLDGTTLFITNLSTMTEAFSTTLSPEQQLLTVQTFNTNDARPGPGFNANDTAFAYVTVTRNNDGTVNFWEVVSVDLASGTTFSFTSNDLSFLARDLTLEARANPLQFEPLVVHVAPNGIVHLQLRDNNVFIPSSTEVEAIAWNATDGTLSLSPYTPLNVYVDPTTGTAYYPTIDPNTPAFQPEFPSLQRNAIAEGVPNGTDLNETILYSSTESLYASVYPANMDGTVFVLTLETTPGGFQFYNPTLDAQPLGLPPSVVRLGTYNGGVLTLALGAGLGTVFFYDANLVNDALWTAPPQQSVIELVWVQSPFVFQSLFSISAMEGTTAQPGVQNCPNTLPSQVDVGDLARVTFTTGVPLRLRANPGLSAQFLQDLAEGTSFEVIGGPQCVDGFTWWNVQLPDGTQGWSAEGDDDTYFMEPLG